MKKLMICRNKNHLILNLFFAVVIFFATNSLVWANDVTVTAVVPDTQAPSVPILIAPSDNALLSDNTPSFQWYESSDNVAMSHYAIYLNGSVFYNNIPLTATENSYYVLAYDSLNGIYTLTPKNSLADRAYTWGIVAFDYADLTASSDVWHFTIDTLAPNFVLTKIGDTDVNISAGNASSVPSEPIIIFANDATANEPILIAYGEANSYVQLTVTIPDDANQIFTTQIDENGYYEFQLGILPRDEDIRLDFIITDRVGHVSVLEEAYFRIELQYWPTPTPTKTPTPTETPTPTPTVTLTISPSLTTSPSVSPTLSTTPSLSPTFTASPSASLSPTLTPTPSVSAPPEPTGFIPIIPPKEIIHEVGDEFIEDLPDSTAEYIRAFLRSKFWQNLSLVIALLFLGVFYLFAFLILMSKFISLLSFALAKKILILLFPPFFKAKKHLVFEHGETLASPLVLVELFDGNGRILDFTITNLQGNFDDLNFPLASGIAWRLQVKDSNFYYPIGDQKPGQLEFWQFYQNQMMNKENYHNQPILIPTLRATGQQKLPFFERLRIYVLYLLDYPIWFLVFSSIIGLIFTLRYPSLLNWIALFFYLVIAILKAVPFIKKQKSLILSVKLPGNQQYYDNLVLSLFEKNSGLGQSLIMPFEFSKSKTIKHDFTNISLTAFAKDFALVKDEIPISSQEILLSKEQEEVPISLNKTEK